MTRPRVLLATMSLTAGNGGVARVARLVAHVLRLECDAGRLNARAIALADREAPENSELAVQVYRGSRWGYVLDIQRSSLSCSHFVYDFLGAARAHCRVPGLRRPSLVFVHGIEAWEDARSDRLDAARRATVLVCNSSYTRSRASRLHSVFERAHTCWLATESDAFPSESTSRTRPPHILVCGRVEEGYKGHDALLEAWPAIADAVPQARMTFVGKGSAALRAQIAGTRHGERVGARGYVAESEMERVFGEATVFAMPSRGEGFGLVYVEAMRHGLPVVASTHDGGSEINVDGETGYNVDLSRKGELAERLIGLLRDPDQARRLGANGQARWRQHFRFSAFHERFAPILREFVQSRAA